MQSRSSASVLHVRARGQLGLADLGHRPGRGELPGRLDARDQRVDVRAVGQVGRVDGGLVPRVGAAQPDPAAAAHRQPAAISTRQRPDRPGRPGRRCGTAPAARATGCPGRAAWRSLRLNPPASARLVVSGPECIICQRARFRGPAFSHRPGRLRGVPHAPCTTGWSDRFVAHARAVGDDRRCRLAPGGRPGPTPDSMSSCGLPTAPAGQDHLAVGPGQSPRRRGAGSARPRRGRPRSRPR